MWTKKEIVKFWKVILAAYTPKNTIISEVEYSAPANLALIKPDCFGSTLNLILGMSLSESLCLMYLGSTFVISSLVDPSSTRTISFNISFGLRKIKLQTVRSTADRASFENIKITETVGSSFGESYCNCRHCWCLVSGKSRFRLITSLTCLLKLWCFICSLIWSSVCSFRVTPLPFSPNPGRTLASKSKTSWGTGSGSLASERNKTQLNQTFLNSVREKILLT